MLGDVCNPNYPAQSDYHNCLSLINWTEIYFIDGVAARARGVKHFNLMKQYSQVQVWTPDSLDTSNNVLLEQFNTIIQFLPTLSSTDNVEFR